MALRPLLLEDGVTPLLLEDGVTALLLEDSDFSESVSESANATDVIVSPALLARTGVRNGQGGSTQTARRSNAQSAIRRN